MIFIYEERAGDAKLWLRGELHKYLIKVRRHTVGDTIAFRNRFDDFLYQYTIVQIDPRSLELELTSSEIKIVAPKKYLHIGWCIVDPSSIEKVLPQLNEIGVSKITFIACARSQKGFKLDFARFGRILEASNQQCGRSHFVEFSHAASLELFLKTNQDAKILDFSPNRVKNYLHVNTVVVGCEGGFAQGERALFDPQALFGFESDFVLRSESAVTAVATKILL